jgi:hypothetical protein
MANYLYLFRGGNMKSMSPRELEDSMNRWRAWVGQLSKQNAYKGGDPLAPDGRVLTGKSRSISDGPFGETKDVVGGYLLVDAPDLATATELARGCPIFDNDGSVEVRELFAMTM